jgi:SAM-dependent methyltransferase
MVDSEDKYVLDAPYTWQFFGYQSPLVLNYVARLNGVETLPLDRPFTYCDLGCGNGLNCNVLADCFPTGQFYGIDFNPEHIANANGIAQKGGGSNVTFLEASFDQLPKSHLPDFDFIALHGIVSWVSAAVCDDLLAVIDRFLKPTGIVYVNYNALPGWEPLLPLADKIRELANGIEGGSLAKIKAVMAPLAALEKQDAPPFKNNPVAREKFASIIDDDPNYLAHEYLNAVVRPLSFETVADDMASIDLAFCGSAEPRDNYIELSVPPDYHDQFPPGEDDRARESRKSALLKSGFRRDLYCRAEYRNGAAGAPAPSFADWVFFDTRLREQEGRGAGDSEHEKVIAAICAAADGTKNVAEICAEPILRDLPEDTVVLAIHRLYARKYLNVVVRKAIPISALPNDGIYFLSPLNLALMQERFFVDFYCDLASPVAGNGRRLQGMQALILVAVHDVGFQAAEELLPKLIDHFRIVWNVDGNPVTDPVQRGLMIGEAFERFRGGELIKWTREGVIAALPPGERQSKQNRISPILG